MRENTAIFTAFDEHSQNDPAEAERNLMRAVLFTALDDVKKSGDAQREARRYLLDNRDYYLYSFMSICQHLKLCPHTVRYIAGLSTEHSCARTQEVLAA